MMTELQTRVSRAEESIHGISSKVSGISGSPVIRSYAGVFFDLNDHLDVLALKKRISGIERQIDTCDTEIRELIQGIKDDPPGAGGGNVQPDWSATEGPAMIANKPETFAPSAHDHSVMDIIRGVESGRVLGRHSDGAGAVEQFTYEETYDRIHPDAGAFERGPLTGADVFSEVKIDNRNRGHVCGLGVRKLTAFDVGAVPADAHPHSAFSWNEVLTGASVIESIVVEDGIIKGVTTRELPVQGGGPVGADLGVTSSVFGQAISHGSADTFARSDHRHPLPSLPATMPPSAHNHGTFNYVQGDLMYGMVFSNLAISQGIVTGLKLRQLTAEDVGAASSWHHHSAANISEGILPIIRGGTGRSTEPQLMTHLGCSNARRGILESLSNTSDGSLPGVTGILGTQHGGTGRALINGETGTLWKSSALASAGFDIGTLPVVYGGTGATTAANARTQLGITPANIGALPTSAHPHSLYNRASSVLANADVFSNIVISQGIVTSIATRALTAANVGALPTAGGTMTGNITWGTGTNRRGLINASEAIEIRGSATDNVALIMDRASINFHRNHAGQWNAVTVGSFRLHLNSASQRLEVQRWNGSAWVGATWNTGGWFQ